MSPPTTAATARWLRSASAARNGLVRAAFLKAIQTQASTARSSSSGRNFPQQRQHGAAVLRRAWRQVRQPGVRGRKAAGDPVHRHGESVGQQSSLLAK